MKKLIHYLFVGLLIAINIPSANAHAQLDSSYPAKNQVIYRIPTFIWLEFDGNLISFGEKSIHRLVVTNSKNQKVSVGKVIVGGPRISTKIKAVLPPGKYLISYRIVSEDGHPVEGSFSFIFRPH